MPQNDENEIQQLREIFGRQMDEELGTEPEVSPIEPFQPPGIGPSPGPLAPPAQPERGTLLRGTTAASLPDIGGRLVNAGMFASMGAPNPIAMGIFGLIGGAIEPSGQEEADLLGMAGSFAASRVPGAGLAARMIRSAPGQGAAAAGATFAGTQDPLQTGIQGAAQAGGTALGNRLRTLTRFGRGGERSRAVKRSGEAATRVAEVERVSAFGPAQVTEELDRLGVEVQPGIFDRFGDPSTQAQVESISAMFSGEAKALVLKRAANRDSALQTFARAQFGKEVPLERLTDLRNVLGTLTIAANGQIQDRGTKRFIGVQLTSDELTALGIKGLDKLAKVDPTKLVNNVVETAANPGSAIDRISAVRKVLAKIHPDLDRTFQRQVVERILEDSRKVISASELIPESKQQALTQGTKFVATLIKMGPKKLETIFGKSAPAMALVSKAFQQFNPAAALSSQNNASFQFALRRMMYSGAGGAFATSGEGGLSNAEGALIGTALGLAGSQSLGSMMIAIVNNPKVGRFLVAAAKNADLIPVALRVLISEADRNREQGIQFRVGEKSFDVNEPIPPTMTRALRGFFSKHQSPQLQQPIPQEKRRVPLLPTR